MIWLAMFIAVLLWWILTGLALMSVHQRVTIKKLVFIGISGCATGAFVSLSSNASDHTIFGVITSFVMALIIWGWLELTYLMGYLTGPTKVPVVGKPRLVTRFRLALGTSLYHEILVLLVLLLSFHLVAGEPNPTVFYTLVILWIMRTSTKLNLFFGVRHFNDHWLPESVQHVKTYISTGKNSPFMSFSTLLAATITSFLFFSGQTASSQPEELSMYLLAWLAALAVLEHCFLMYPMGESALWRWAGAAIDSE